MKRPDIHYTTCPNEDCPDIQCRDRRRHEAKIKLLEDEVLLIHSLLEFTRQQLESWQEEFHRSERYRAVANGRIRYLKNALKSTQGFVEAYDNVGHTKALIREILENK